MTDKIGLHNWDYPVPFTESNEDEDTWGSSLRNYVKDQLDKDVPLSGPVSNRPSGGTYPGMLWVVEDTSPKEITFDDGANWVTVGTTDASTLNGYQADAFAALDEDESINGMWTFVNAFSGQNSRYETSDGSGTAVDNADQLGGIAASNYAHTGQGETITAGWTFDSPQVFNNAVNFNNTIDVRGSNGHVDLFEDDNNGKQWRFEVQNGTWQVTEVGVDNHLQVDPGGLVRHPGGAAFGSKATFNAAVEFTQEATGSVEQAGKVASQTVNGGHSDFASAQAAIDFADTNGYNNVEFPAGTYGSITIPNAMTVTGPGLGPAGSGNVAYFDGGTSTGISMNRGSRVDGIEAGSTDGDGIAMNGGDCRITDCWIQKAATNGIWTNQSWCVVTGCTSVTSNMTNTIALAPNSSDCIVTDNTSVTVNDTGTNNITSHNI